MIKISKFLRNLIFTIIFFAAGGKPKALAQGPMDMPTLYGTVSVSSSPVFWAILILRILVPIAIVVGLAYLLFRRRKK